MVAMQVVWHGTKGIVMVYLIHEWNKKTDDDNHDDEKYDSEIK